MWQVYALIAQDMIRERQREAAANALARAVDGQVPLADRGGIVRRASIGLLRRVESAATAVSRQACTAATRIERPTA
jgi:hypothetical protein